MVVQRLSAEAVNCLLAELAKHHPVVLLVVLWLLLEQACASAALRTWAAKVCGRSQHVVWQQRQQARVLSLHCTEYHVRGNDLCVDPRRLAMHLCKEAGIGGLNLHGNITTWQTTTDAKCAGCNAAAHPAMNRYKVVCDQDYIHMTAWPYPACHPLLAFAAAGVPQI